MNLDDTILAISSPPGPAARGLIRLSGSDAWRLAATVVALPTQLAPGWYPNPPLPLLHPTAKLAAVLLFRAPRSFTGQDIAELHLPGSPALLRATLAQLLENAKSVGGLQGSARLAERTAELLALVEAGIDFTDEEDVSFAKVHEVYDALEQLGEAACDLVEQSVRVDRLDRPPTVVLVGKPNVGKSSLINALTGQPRAIVSNIAGTTRDMLAASMHTSGGEIRLIDVPGEEPPTDELRIKMMEARARALLEADLVMEITDEKEEPARYAVRSREHDFHCPHIVVQNKADLRQESPGDEDEGMWLPGTGKSWGRVSARTGYNIALLREVIVRLVSRNESAGAHRTALNERHRVILKEAQWSFWAAARFACDEVTFARHPELLAAELRRALDLLGQITGTISPDEVLGRIFSRFCIGK